MASINFSYRSTKDRNQIEIRLSYRQDDQYKSQRTRTQFYYNSVAGVSKAFWNEYQSGVNFRDVEKGNLKTELDIHLSELETFILKAFERTAKIPAGWLKIEVNEYYNPERNQKVPSGLLDYWDYYLNLRESEIKQKPRTWLKWNEIKNKIARFQNDTGRRYQIKDINDEFKRDWIRWNESERYATATIKKNLSYIKTVCTHAATKGIETSKDLPNLKTGIKTESYKKPYLSFAELEKIEALENLPERLDNTRDWLIISCYTGQRVSDFMRFKPSMIREAKGRKFIDIKQQKTGKDITVPLLPQVEKILSKRSGNFPRRISDQRYNEYLKEVCKLAGITQKIKGKLSTKVKINGRKAYRDLPGTYEKWQLIGSHTGRRSFATNYYGKIPTTYLKNITGHSTEAMLLEYIGKTSKDTAADAFDALINV